MNNTNQNNDVLFGDNNQNTLGTLEGDSTKTGWGALDSLDLNTNLTSVSYQDTMADLTREQWEGFRTRFLPVQNDLVSLSNNNQLLTEQLDRNKVNIDNSFASAEQNESIRLGRYGLTPENSKQDKNNNNLLKSLTTASVNNETRSTVNDLQNKIITGQGGTPQTLADIGKS